MYGIYLWGQYEKTLLYLNRKIDGSDIPTLNPASGGVAEKSAEAAHQTLRSNGWERQTANMHRWGMPTWCPTQKPNRSSLSAQHKKRTTTHLPPQRGGERTLDLGRFKNRNTGAHTAPTPHATHKKRHPTVSEGENPPLAARSPYTFLEMARAAPAWGPGPPVSLYSERCSTL